MRHSTRATTHQPSLPDLVLHRPNSPRPSTCRVAGERRAGAGLLPRPVADEGRRRWESDALCDSGFSQSCASSSTARSPSAGPAGVIPNAAVAHGPSDWHNAHDHTVATGWAAKLDFGSSWPAPAPQVPRVAPSFRLRVARACGLGCMSSFSIAKPSCAKKRRSWPHFGDCSPGGVGYSCGRGPPAGLFEVGLEVGYRVADDAL
jgi:hypothetical protein